MTSQYRVVYDESDDSFTKADAEALYAEVCVCVCVWMCVCVCVCV